jgi:hypothetical protein
MRLTALAGDENVGSEIEVADALDAFSFQNSLDALGEMKEGLPRPPRGGSAPAYIAQSWHKI